jgi:iron(III) transport system substrate-binding protein
MVVVPQADRMKIRVVSRHVVPVLAGLWRPTRLKAELHTWAIGLLILIVAGCGKSERAVVVYTSQDQIYAEPILAEFTKETGIKVLPVFDSESVKTAGLLQRLLAEKGNPRADVFWSNEEMFYRQMIQRGALDSNLWARVGYRARRLIINTNLVHAADMPQSLEELTGPKWTGKVALAYPVYGTTAAHMAALREFWGDAKWKKWIDALAANKPFIVDGNSVVVRMVGAGEALVGLTDSDDLAAGLRNHLPIAAAPASEKADEFLRIPNCVGMVAGAPHPSEAKAFVEFVQSEKIARELVNDHALESARSEGACLSLSSPVEETLQILRKTFARE